MRKTSRKLTIRAVSAILAGMLAITACGSAGNSAAAEQTESTDESKQEASSTASSTEPQEPTHLPIPQDFIMGMDASSVLAEDYSNVAYFNFDGILCDPFYVLADAGINYIRIRVWNDPYDENGNGYGGGNNDVETAIALGKRATAAGMKVCIDFHYSDFWADPKRQHAPKAWEGKSVDEKCNLLSEFTEDALSKMLDEGIDIGMVQVGNEINYGMSGESNIRDVLKLLDSGCNAVRGVSEKYDQDIKIAIHYTNIKKKGEVDNLVHNLLEANIDFDAIGLSYYPFWDGSFDNMKSMVSAIQKRHGKEVFIAETSYPYTLEDGDGFPNSVSSPKELMEGYPATVEGQKNMIADVIQNANDAGAFGVFYWEGTWIPVGSDRKSNEEIWEKYGSGWASSYSKDYDPEDAGLYYGGCSWDNQALFDFKGNPLDSLKVFGELKR